MYVCVCVCIYQNVYQCIYKIPKGLQLYFTNLLKTSIHIWKKYIGAIKPTNAITIHFYGGECLTSGANSLVGGSSALLAL